MKPTDYTSAFMQKALALLEGTTDEEVPVSCIVVMNQEIIGKGINQTIRLHDSTAHAEIIALQQAFQVMGDWRLDQADVFVIMEPCLMCMGALRLARVRSLYYGISNAVSGVFTRYPGISCQDFPEMNIQGGLLEEEIREKIQCFFQNQRK